MENNSFSISTTTVVEISFIIPCFNEVASIDALYHEIAKTVQINKVNAEIIFIDDGSTDGTLEHIICIAQTDARIKYISFSRNFGHQKAIKAGLNKAIGKAAIMMDADLQHPVSFIPELIDRWKAGYEIVNTIRIDEKNKGLFKKVTSKLFYTLINFLSEVKIKAGSADFRLLDRKVIEVLKNCHEEFFFLRGMTSWCGFRSCDVEYQAHKRFAGKTKYSFLKMLSLALCGITSFSIKPLRLAILFASGFVLLSFLEIIYVIYIVAFTSDSISGWASLAILISLLGAAILFTLGIIGEYLGKLFIENKRRPEYVIRMEN